MGNIVGFAFDKVQEGLSWLVSLISQGINWCFQKLKEAVTWLISKMKKFFNYLFNWMSNSLNRMRRFFDNFLEKFTDALLKSEKMIGTTLEKVAKIMSSIVDWFQCPLQRLELKLMNLVTSLVENSRDLLGHNKEFISMVCEAEKITGQRLKLVQFGKDEQKNPSEIANILSDLQKSCLPFLDALSKLEEFEKLSFPLPEEFEEEKIEGFFPNKFESLADENEGKGASAFSKPEEFGEENIGFTLSEDFEEEIDGFFPMKFESLADENEGKIAQSYVGPCI